jgi:hypothetical protein
MKVKCTFRKKKRLTSSSKMVLLEKNFVQAISNKTAFFLKKLDFISPNDLQNNWLPFL